MSADVDPIHQECDQLSTALFQRADDLTVNPGDPEHDITARLLIKGVILNAVNRRNVHALRAYDRFMSPVNTPSVTHRIAEGINGGVLTEGDDVVYDSITAEHFIAYHAINSQEFARAFTGHEDHRKIMTYAMRNPGMTSKLVEIVRRGITDGETVIHLSETMDFGASPALQEGAL